MSWLITFAVAVLFALPFYFGVRRTRDKDVALLTGGLIAGGLCVLGTLNILAI